LSISRERIEKWLAENRIEYVWLGKELGGYRKGGYKRHVRSKLFKGGIEQLLEIVKNERACIVCMEANPKYCHRKFISAYLEGKGVRVTHIIAKGEESPAQVLNSG